MPKKVLDAGFVNDQFCQNGISKPSLGKLVDTGKVISVSLILKMTYILLIHGVGNNKLLC